MSKGTQISPAEKGQAMAAIEAFKSAGLSDKEIGERAGVTQQAVNLWRKDPERSMSRQAYERLVGSGPATRVAPDDPLERVIATRWWLPGPAPDPAVVAQIHSRARSERAQLDDALSVHYWEDYLRRLAGELATHGALDKAGAGRRKSRNGSGRGPR